MTLSPHSWAYRSKADHPRFEDFEKDLGHRYAAITTIMDTDWPQMINVRIALYEYFSPALYLLRSPALVPIYNHGAEAYKKALGLPDIVRAKRFLDAIDQMLMDRLINLTVQVGREQVWEPKGGNPVMAWMPFTVEDPVLVQQRDLSQKERSSALRAVRKHYERVLPSHLHRADLP